MATRYINPVHRDYLADPFVWRVGAEYFAIGTGASEAAGEVTRSTQPTVFPVLQSRDLVTWRSLGRALVRPDPAFGNAYWAPEVAFAEGRWFLYYSVGHDDRLHQLRVSVSDCPEGPYRDHGALTDLSECAFAIDPHPFCDDDGAWYLFHARDFLDTYEEQGVSVRAGTALVVHRLTSMTELCREGHTVARARYDWQRFAAERLMYGRVFDWHTLEGPAVVKRNGRYLCLYSGGCWQTRSYGVDYVVAEHVCGPYIDRGAEQGPRVLRTRPPHVLGPGHCSVVDTPRGEVIAYHAWDVEMTARRLCIDLLQITADEIRSPGPTWTEQLLPAD